MDKPVSCLFPHKKICNDQISAIRIFYLYLDWLVVQSLIYNLHKPQITGDFGATLKMSKLKCNFTQISIHEMCDTCMK